VSVRVVLVGGVFENRDGAARALLRHFRVAVPVRIDHDPDTHRATVRLPGVSERDAREACDLYLTAHGILRFIEEGVTA
jgi:hypothetical protein